MSTYVLFSDEAKVSNLLQLHDSLKFIECVSFTYQAIKKHNLPTKISFRFGKHVGFLVIIVRMNRYFSDTDVSIHLIYKQTLIQFSFETLLLLLLYKYIDRAEAEACYARAVQSVKYRLNTGLGTSDI